MSLTPNEKKNQKKKTIFDPQVLQIDHSLLRTFLFQNHYMLEGNIFVFDELVPTCTNYE